VLIERMLAAVHVPMGKASGDCPELKGWVAGRLQPAAL